MKLISRIVIVLALFIGLGMLIGVEREDLTSARIGAQIDAVRERAATLLSAGRRAASDGGGAEAARAPSPFDAPGRDGADGATMQIDARALRRACAAAKARGEPDAPVCAAPEAGRSARAISDLWDSFDAANESAFLERIARERGANPVTPPPNASAAAAAAAPYAVERLRHLIATGLDGDEAAWMELLRLYKAATPEQRVRINRLEAEEKARR